jgi:drug/metabolite transporter (DMT)-like permease
MDILKQILGESLTSVYAAVTKGSSLNVVNQTFIRSLVYSLASIPGMDFNTVKNLILSPAGLGLSITNIIHVLSSYYAFKKLPVGMSILFFYTYPIFYLLLSSTNINWKIWSLIGLCMFGIFIIYTDYSFHTLGMISIFISAITEALILFLVNKINSQSNSNEMFLTYYLTTIVTLPFISLDVFKMAGLKIGLFNLFVGFTGHTLLYGAVKKLPPVIYTLVSYIGIVVSFFIGKFIFGEKSTIISWVGVGIILASIFGIRFIGTP